MFVLAKLVGWALEPLNLLGALLLVAVALLFTRSWRLGRIVAAAALAFYLAFGALPVAPWLLAPLENRFPQPVLPDRVDGIIVLGGAMDAAMTEARGQPSLGGAAERLTALIPLARTYPQAVLVFTGGSGSVTDQIHKEAPAARAFLAQMGLDTDRIIFEGQSRNTIENVAFSKELVQPQPGQIWLLVTSAAHMPRAVGLFRGADWPVIAYPVDYATAPEQGGWGFSPGGGMQAFATAMHEWAGLAVNRLTGHSTELFPAPVTK